MAEAKLQALLAQPKLTQHKLTQRIGFARMNRIWVLFTVVAFVPNLQVVWGDLIDNFDNGAVADSDASLGFWGTDSFGGSSNDISESGGELTFTVGGNAGSSGLNAFNFAGTSIYSNDFRSDFNFLANTATIQVRGINIASTGSPFVPVDQRLLRVGFVSSGENAFVADDAVFLRITETEVSLRSKTNEADANGQGTEQATLGSINGVGGFDLEIGPGLAGTLDYSLTAFFPSGATASSASGSFAYDASQWNQADLSSRLLVMAQEWNVSGDDQIFSATLDSISVTSAAAAVPEPSSWVFCTIVVLGLGRLRFRKV